MFVLLITLNYQVVPKQFVMITCVVIYHLSTNMSA